MIAPEICLTMAYQGAWQFKRLTAAGARPGKTGPFAMPEAA